MKRVLILSLAVLGLAAVGSAGNINYVGTVKVSLNGGANNCNASYLQLQFNCVAGGFNVTSSAAGVWSPILGGFTLTTPGSGSSNYTGIAITMDVTFSTPAGVAPSPGHYTGTLSGTVNTGQPTNTINIVWNGGLNYTYPGGKSIALAPNNLTVAAGGIALNDTGAGYDSATPEPATMSLIGGALVGLGLLRRRKSTCRTTLRTSKSFTGWQ